MQGDEDEDEDVMTRDGSPRCDMHELSFAISLLWIDRTQLIDFRRGWHVDTGLSREIRTIRVGIWNIRMDMHGHGHDMA